MLGGGKRALGFQIPDADPNGDRKSLMAEIARSSADRLENRLEFEMLLADLSSRFINLCWRPASLPILRSGSYRRRLP